METPSDEASNGPTILECGHVEYKAGRCLTADCVNVVDDLVPRKWEPLEILTTAVITRRAEAFVALSNTSDVGLRSVDTGMLLAYDEVMELIKELMPDES